ncbi:DUF362 domain-containing protein [bacterium]|nr:DUF362 domain-containing protein [bacterium]
MTIFEKSGKNLEDNLASLRKIFTKMKKIPFGSGDTVGIKIHWGERGNVSFLPPEYTREIVRWLKSMGAKPFVFDTTVLYRGGRRNGDDAINTARQHGFSKEFLGCPIVIADGNDGTNTIEIPAGYRHFETVQVADIFSNTDGFVIFSHFKGHMVAGFGGAVKNISMGFASRAQKQRMHTDSLFPQLNRDKCTKCGVCIQHCPAGAVSFDEDGYPVFNLQKCISCGECIALCPQVALKILWNTDKKIFQEKLVETAAAVWKIIAKRTVLINALIKITKECDCLPGENPAVTEDIGFVAGYHPVEVDAKSIEVLGEDIIDNAHRNIPWRRQFEYAKEIKFTP